MISTYDNDIFHCISQNYVSMIIYTPKRSNGATYCPFVFYSYVINPSYIIYEYIHHN